MSIQLDRQFSTYDRKLLAAMERAFQPKAMVAVETYCAAIEANDHITRQNFTLRMQRKKLMRRMRAMAKRRDEFRQVAIGLGAIVVMLAVVLAIQSGSFR